MPLLEMRNIVKEFPGVRTLDGVRAHSRARFSLRIPFRGKQQKVVLRKWLLTRPKVLFLDQPTRGIDVGAKQEIYAEINKLAKEGLAIVLVSSELPEVLGLSDRIIVLYRGRVAAAFTRTEATADKVLAEATGGH